MIRNQAINSVQCMLDWVKYDWANCYTHIISIYSRANSSTIKKCCFFSSNPENSFLIDKVFDKGASPPLPLPPGPKYTSKSNFVPPSQKC